MFSDDEWTLHEGRFFRFLQEALQKEARLVQHFDLVVMNRILTPVQACIFLGDGWPSFCDCLAFTRALLPAVVDNDEP